MKPAGGLRRVAASTALLLAAACTSQTSEARPPDPAPAPAPSPTTSATTPSASESPSTSPSEPPSASPTRTPTEPPTQTPTEEPVEPLRRFTVAMSGDVLLHEGLWSTARLDAAAAGEPGMDFRPLLASMRPVLSEADLAICHMETPLAPPGGPYAGYPLFSAPPQVTRALEWAGFDVCTTASNHSLDQGVEGLRRTLETLDRNGLDYAGTARTQREARRPVLVEAGDATVGLVSQTYGTNGIPIPDDQPWSVPLIDTDAALEAAERASRAGADVVLVALHWGLEYQQAPTPEQTAIARRLLRSPYVDLVYGHHAHVVQPFDRVRGKWVAYGLGNMVAQQLTEITGVYDGVTARFTFVERRGGGFRVTRAEFIPTYITPLTTEQPRMRLLRITDALRDDSEAASGAELRAALRRVRGAVDLLGAREGGLRLLRR